MADAAMTLGALGEIRRHSWWFLALGILFIVGGVFAIVMPFIASLAVAGVIAVALVWLGIVQIIQAWGVKSWSDFIWALIIGLIMLAGGIAIWWNPLIGAATLTIFLAAVFVAKGVFQIVLGFRMRPYAGWGWMLTAGILAVIIGVLIWLNWPFSTVWALGTLAGISLIFSGWSYIMVSIAARRLQS